VTRRFPAIVAIILPLLCGAVGAGLAGTAGERDGSPSLSRPAAAGPQAASPGTARRRERDIELIADSVLRYNLLVTWYGNPHTPKMGILGEYTGEELANGLAAQAKAYEPETRKRVQPAYELVAIVAQGTPGRDAMWRRRESAKVIDAMLADARAHGFKLVLDVQVGHSTVKSELAYLRRYLEEPDVYLALDPEFHMWEGQQPGHIIGHTLADDVNYAIDVLDDIIAAKRLPPKVLIVHQFTMNMLPDKERVKDSRMVDVALCMDGWGVRPLKLATYRMVVRKPLEYAAIKLFYRKDGDMLAPGEALNLAPSPAVVIYQ
jgi:hypothetical protein